MDSRERGKISLEVLKFYSDLRLAKDGERPVVDGGRFMRRMKEDILAYNDLSLDFLKACVISYLDLEDDWIERDDHPLHSFPTVINKCQQEVNRNYKFFKGTREEYYQDYIKRTMDKLNKNDDGGKHRQKDPESSGMD